MSRQDGAEDALFGQNGKRAVSGRLMQRCAANGAVAAKRDGLLAQSIRAEAAAESPSYGMTMKKAIAKYKISPQIIQQKHMQKQQADDTKNNRILWAVPGRGTQRRNFCDIGDQQEKGNGGHRKRHAPREGSPLGQCGHAQHRLGGYKVFVSGHFDGAGYAVGAVGNCGLGHKNQLLIENWVETIGGKHGSPVAVFNSRKVSGRIWNPPLRR